MSLDWIHVGIAIFGFLASGMAAVWRVSWIVSQIMPKINEQMLTMKAEYNALLELKEAEFGKNIGRVYQRFDEYKEHIEGRFTSKEMCNVLHASSSATMISMEKKLDDLTKKVDSLLMRDR